MDFDRAFDLLMGSEGDYSNRPSDPGGETMWGITVAVARANGYLGDMRALPKFTAKEIAKKAYWDKVRGDELPAALRFPLFDAAYNSGPKQAIKWLQRAVDVQDDGALGPMTLAAAGRQPERAAARMTGERLDFMTSLPIWPEYSKGWARRIASILKEA